MTQTHQDVLSYRGQELRGSDGEKLGTIEEIYLDTDTQQPEWAVVTTGLVGTKQTFVPIGDAGTSADGLTVPYDKATIKDAPNIDPNGQLTEPEERQLYEHYGRSYNPGTGDRDFAESTGHGDADTVGRDV